MTNYEPMIDDDLVLKLDDDNNISDSSEDSDSSSSSGDHKSDDESHDAQLSQHVLSTSNQPSAFELWLNKAAETQTSTKPMIATAVNNLRRSLGDKLRQPHSNVTTWLAEALKQSKSVFTCSGTIQLDVNNNNQTTPISDASTSHSSRPRNMRMVFNRPNKQTVNQSSVSQPTNLLEELSVYQMMLPLHASATESDISDMMKRIISLCKPATFGVGGQTVFDPSYRSCDHLSPECFTTNFTPLDTMPNIMNEITRVLCTNRTSSLFTAGLRAELYKLNVYSTGGTFKSHRDTPRSNTMIGSLLVCLPIPHSGGTLIVRHPQNGEYVNYDWALSTRDEKKLNQLQWCAFYGDCEHEILPVTSGYRVTLTYNLYSEEQIAQVEPVANPTTPLASPLSDHHARLLQAPFPSLLCLLLLSPSFMPSGGKLGIYCHHGYAHTSAAAAELLNPRLLKGGDAVIYESVRALGVKCDFLPVVKDCVILPHFQPPDTKEDNYWDDEDMSLAWECEDKNGKPGKQIIEVMKHQGATDIKWVNKGEGVKELQEAHHTYGNEPMVGVHYSKAALIIYVHRWDESINGRNSAPLPVIEQIVTIDLHPHPLQKTRTHKDFKCQLCVSSKAHQLGQRWRCVECGDDYSICFSCQRDPVKKTRTWSEAFHDYIF